MAVVDKGSFPTLFKKLWENISAENLVFRGSGLWLFNSSAVSSEKLILHRTTLAAPDDFFVKPLYLPLHAPSPEILVVRFGLLKAPSY